MAAAPQSLDRNSGGALYAGGKSCLPNSFYALSAETTHGRAAAPDLQPETARLSPSLRAAPQSCPPCQGHLPPKTGHPKQLVPALRLARMELPVPCAQLAKELLQPSSGRPCPETAWECSGFHPCPHVLPLVMALDGVTRTPGEPLATHSSSCVLAKPARGLPVASFPKRSPEAKPGPSDPAMNPD